MTMLIQKAMQDNPIELTEDELKQVSGGATIQREELCWSEEMMKYWLEARLFD